MSEREQLAEVFEARLADFKAKMKGRVFVSEYESWKGWIEHYERLIAMLRGKERV